MKNTFLLFLLSFLAVQTSQAQNMNWKWADSERPYYAHLNLGYDFGFTTQVGYNYFTTIKKPVLLTVDYSLPMGKQLFDDFKFRLGGQVQALEYKNFVLSLKMLGNVKRYETEMVRMSDFGAETSLLMGYYKPKWHVAAELGLMKAFTSHVKHGDVIKENFPAVADGWYGPSGGYYFYGLQAGKSITQGLDMSFRIGSTDALGNDKDALINKYAQIGLMKKF